MAAAGDEQAIQRLEPDFANVKRYEAEKVKRDAGDEEAIARYEARKASGLQSQAKEQREGNLAEIERAVKKYGPDAPPPYSDEDAETFARMAEAGNKGGESETKAEEDGGKCKGLCPRKRERSTERDEEAVEETEQNQSPARGASGDGESRRGLRIADLLNEDRYEEDESSSREEKRVKLTSEWARLNTKRARLIERLTRLDSKMTGVGVELALLRE